MSNTQRIIITEKCSETDKYNLPKETKMYAREIKRFLCEQNSYVDIKKTLVVTHQKPSSSPGKVEYTTYAVLDVFFRDTEQGQSLQDIVLEELDRDNKATLQVSECLTWTIMSVGKSQSWLIGARSSMTTYYYKSRDEDIYLPDPEPFTGLFDRIKLDEGELPGPVPMYRDMKEEYILDRGNVELDEPFLDPDNAELYEPF